MEYTDDGSIFEVVGCKRKHRADVVKSAVNVLTQNDMLKEIDKGLFEGFGQTFAIVR